MQRPHAVGLLATAGLSARGLVVSTIASGLALTIGVAGSVPERERALIVVWIWLAFGVLQLRVVVRALPWLAPWLALMLSQTLHLIEHAAQMAQIHILGTLPSAAHGIVSALDVEWVHLIWNTFVLIATVLLLSQARGNTWLQILVALALVHEVEHLYLTWGYVQTGVAGAPGLFARGGAIAGGLPLARPDLHFLYNLTEVVLLGLALGSELARSRARGLRPQPNAPS